MAELVLPTILVALFSGTPRRLTVDGATVGEALASLDRRVPGMGDRLLTVGPALREHIKVFVDSEPADLETPVGPASVVHVITAVSGG
jgi:molybdopterin converting factor small subunit